MAGGGQYPIMARGVHLDNLGAGGLPHGAHARQGRGIGFGNGGEDDPVALKESTGGYLDAAFFGAGDGMGRNEVAGYFAEGRSRCGEDAALGASAIGNDGIGREPANHSAKYGLHGAERHGDNDHVGVDNGLGDISLEPIDHAKRKRPFQIWPPPTTSDDPLAGVGFAERAREGSADGPNPDDAERVYFHINSHCSAGVSVCMAFWNSWRGSDWQHWF